jgi:hypothetical protein
MQDRDDIPATLLEMQARRHRAMVEADLVTLDALLDDALTCTHSDASLASKRSYLAKAREGALHYAEVSSADEEVSVLSEDAACVFGRMQLAGENAGALKRFDYRFHRSLGAPRRSMEAGRVPADACDATTGFR